jgi:hypothetical protein
VSRQAANSSRREGGTASVELIGVIPFLLLAVLVAAQIAAAGAALWSAGVAARAGARAALVGGDAAGAARRTLPDTLRADAEVEDSDAVSVRVSVPRLLPGMPRIRVEATSSLDGRRG